MLARATSLARQVHALLQVRERLERELALTERVASLQLRQALASGVELPWRDAGFRVFSQSDEDGLLVYLLTVVGTTTRILVDIGAGRPDGSNSTNLILHHGWRGILVDADPDSVRALESFYAKRVSTTAAQPTIVSARVTPETVDELVSGLLSGEEVDLLSIDVDGLDYWIWRSLESIRPRIVVAEVQALWDPNRSVTVPNDPSFQPVFRDGFGIYSGASLAAFCKLASAKGYSLVGSNMLGFNAFFIRDDVLASPLRRVEPAEITSLPFPTFARQRYLREVEHLPWVTV
jgi:hypothetical protein